ncbi:hypothetical protein Tco_0990548 [Tanacetum coccineum]|uniref:Uncharacterized protein n=1 Tax=Tanacetum coccineum TaxID=301880 RepID=A0ABQ5EXG0_9ASTR
MPKGCINDTAMLPSWLGTNSGLVSQTEEVQSKVIIKVHFKGIIANFNIKGSNIKGIIAKVQYQSQWTNDMKEIERANLNVGYAAVYNFSGDRRIMTGFIMGSERERIEL